MRSNRERQKDQHACDRQHGRYELPRRRSYQQRVTRIEIRHPESGHDVVDIQGESAQRWEEHQERIEDRED